MIGSDRKAIKEPVKGNKVAKVPVIMQLEALECGAACLDMILAYYEKWIPLEQVRRDCGVSRDGSNARNVMLAAQNYGLNAEGFRVEKEYLEKNGTFPCIIYWNGNHFVVLDGFRKGRAVLNDPARGLVEVSMEEFDMSFTGIMLEMTPGENFEPGGHPKSIMGFVKKKLKGLRSAFIFAFCLYLVTAICDMFYPGFQRVFLDRLLTGKSPEWAMPFLILLCILTAIEITNSLINRFFLLRLEGKLAISSNASYMWHILHLPMEFYSQRQAGDIAMRKQTNATIAGTLISTFTPLVMDTALMFFYLYLMIRYDFSLSLVGVAGILINTFVQKYISDRKVNISRVMMRDLAKLQSTTVAGVEMIETIKASGVEDEFFARWAGYQASVNRQNTSSTRISNGYGLILQFVSMLSNNLILALGLLYTMQGHFTVGMLFGFTTLLTRFSSPVAELTSARDMIRQMRTDMERIEDVMEYRADVPETDPVRTEETNYTKLSGKIEMKNVTFGYSRLAKPLIENFNLTIEPGQKIAFVGSSGCGKSTLAKLLTGLYKPWSGEILFDGMPREEIDRNRFTGSVAMVDQEVTLFEDTIENNIKLWDNSIEDFEMVLASRDASIHSEIIQREGGYNYILRENGKDLSGGQRQRLEIARVLAQDPTVIIMDEATSALDARTEAEVVQAIQDRGITCIVVAHRLSTIRDCDEIIVMENGHVVERGTHKELYQKGSFYTKLVTSE
jgi:NHLM bacteriocin system ABC transporter peptidase/ATP-binding protein